MVTNLLSSVAVLSALLVWNFSKSWVAVPGLSEIISLALSLSSTILAVIAIVQALVSSSESSKILLNILSASSNMVGVSSDLSHSATKLDEVIDILQDIPLGMTNISKK
jgi:hypothetical protein